MIEYNVKCYGAWGDGVADDGPAISRAMQACYENDGGTVYLPCGVYRVAAPLQVPVLPTGSMRIVGDGPTTTDVVFIGSGYCFSIGDGGVNNAQYTSIESMTIRATGATNPDGAVKLNHTRFTSLRTLTIKDFSKAGSRGVYIVGGVHNYFALVDQCRFLYVATGIYMNGGTGVGANSNHIRQCHFGAHSAYAVHIDGGDTNTMEFNEFNGSITTAVRIEGDANDTKIMCNQFDGATVGVHVASVAADRTLLMGNTGSVNLNDQGTGTRVI